MNIGKAIEVNNAIRNDETVTREDWFEAVGLGIEALKQIQQDRDWIIFGDFIPLPGETKD